MSSLSVVPREIICHLFEYVNFNGNIFEVNCLDKRCNEIVFTLMQKKARQILEDAKLQNSCFYQWINERFFSEEMNSRAACIELFRAIIAKAKSFEHPFTHRIPQPWDIKQLSDKIQLIEDADLEQIGPKLANGINSLDFPFKALQIRNYLNQNLDLIRNVSYLYLINKKIRVIPSEISRFTNLCRLNITGNQIQIFPASLCQLTALKELCLSVNRIDSIPAQIFQLKELTTLNMSCNQLPELHSALCQLENLIELNMSSNSIDRISLCISQLTSLKILNLSKNHIRELPPEIGKLKSLTWLNLSKNQIQVMPLEIVELTALQTLNISKNLMSSVPAEFNRLDSLIKLNIVGNPVQDIPIEIRQLLYSNSLRIQTSSKFHIS
jgi:Leucine-rich repeat (LRR) protein